MTTDPIGGVWLYSVELCRELAKRDVSVVLATMGRRLERGERVLISGLHNVELCESTYKLEWMSEPWSDVKAAGRWLLDLESRFQPSLIHLNQYSHGAVAWKVPALVVGHSLLGSWEKHYGRFAAAEPIYNGRSGARFAPGKKDDVIFTAGRLWDEAKNIASLNSVVGKIPWQIYAAGESR